MFESVSAGEIRPTTAQGWQHESLAAAVSRLNEEDRLILGLFYSECLSLAEIAQVMGRSEECVATDFYLAHEALGALKDAGREADAAA